MKKIIIVIVFLCLGSMLYAKDEVDLGIGFQYGLAMVFDDGEIQRDIMEPGLLATFRATYDMFGFFGRFGLLFPCKVSEGNFSVDYNNYDYILFANSGFGAAIKIPLDKRFALIFDIGLSINDLFYGGSYKDNIDATWKIKIENMGSPFYLTGGDYFTNVSMKDKYNDWAFGVLGNAAVRFRFSDLVSLEFGIAGTFDFLRYRSYRFIADFTFAHSSIYWYITEDYLKAVFPGAIVNGKQVTLGSNGKFNTFKQFTVIPSLCVFFSF